MAGQGEGQAPDMDEKEWLRRTGIPPSHAATVAFYVISHSGLFPESRVAKSPLPREFCSRIYDDSTYAEELRAWRFPEADVDLLQLAVLHNKEDVVRDLSRIFRRRSNYQDGSGRYRNHPLHLACHSAGHEVVARVLRMQPPQLPEEGEVTVTVDPGQCSPEAPVVQLPSPVRGNIVHFAALNKKPVAHAFLSESLPFCRRHLTQQKIEWVWCLLDFVYDSGQAPQAAYALACPVRCIHDKPDDYYLMVCQLFHQDERRIGNECVALCALVDQALKMGRPDLVRAAASYCSQKQLHEFVQHVENWRAKPDQNPNDEWDINEAQLYTINHRRHATVWEHVNDVFREEQINRTLLQETVLAILRSVGGNPRKAKLLDLLPQPLLDKFSVPFHGPYEELIPSSQESQQTTSQ